MDTPKHQQQNTPAQYTTVGSIYNPHATPLQPPARRGRTVKWPPADYPAKTNMPGFSFMNSMSPPTTANSLLQYSPLQQNSARAVSPNAVSPDSAATSGIPSGSLLDAAGACDKQDKPNSDDDEDHETLERMDNLKSMPVRSLHSLAAFPNPNQKAAQTMLTRARTSASTGNSSQPARPEPTFMANLLQSDGVSEYGMSARDLAYSSVLSKGPGAPRPLTAGPPGLRQHKTSAAESVDPSAHQISSRRSSFSNSRPTANAVRKPASDESNSSKVVDTLSMEQARPFFPKGYPPNFKFQTNPLPSDWCEDRPVDRFGLPKRRPQDNLEAHQARVNASWYAGNVGLNKTMSQIIQEKNRRQLERTLGIFRQETSTSNNEELDMEELTIEESNGIPVKEHIKPLLSMVYQSFLNRPAIGDYSETGNWEWSA